MPFVRGVFKYKNVFCFLGSFFSFIVANCDHRILVNHCYWPVASDLLNIFSHKYVVKTFLESDQLLNQWMDLVTLVTGKSPLFPYCMYSSISRQD